MTINASYAHRLTACKKIGFAIALFAGSVSVAAGDREDRADKAIEAANKAAERSMRDSARAAEDSARSSERDRLSDIKSAEDASRTDADMQKQATKDAADAAEDAAKAAEDAAKDAADAAEDAAKAAEDAAKDAADAAEDAMDDHYGSSTSMRDLASEESPDFDDRGFPVRSGEIVGIDIDEAALSKATTAGFVVIERSKLPALDAEVIRLAAPKGMDSSSALKLIRSTDSGGSYDLTHYYGLLFTPQGKSSGQTRSPAKAKSGSLEIGMIDTGIASHNALSKLALTKRDFSGGKNPAPTEHGTAIASLLAGEGTATLLAANIFKGSSANPHTSADAIVQALEWMVEQKVTVINISLAGPRNKILDALVRKASNLGHVIVAAAGNGGPSAAPAYPAALPEVVAVTAVDKKLRVYRYANQGSYVRVAALGVDVAAASANGKTALQSGTSFATPHIAAWMARCTGPKSATARVKCLKKLEAAARDLGEPGRDAVYGFGYVS